MVPRDEESTLGSSSLDHEDSQSIAGIPQHTTDTRNGHELEKQETAHSVANTSRSKARVTRTQSLTRRSLRNRFTHPLQHVKTSEEFIVDFDGADDPYRPMNWPFRKKVVTTLLYG